MSVEYFALGHQPQDDVCSGASTIPGMVSLVESCLVDSFLSFASWIWLPTPTLGLELERFRLPLFFLPPLTSPVLTTPGPSPIPEVELECLFFCVTACSTCHPDFCVPLLGVVSADLALYAIARSTARATRRLIIIITNTKTVEFDLSSSPSVSVVRRWNAWEYHKLRRRENILLQLSQNWLAKHVNLHQSKSLAIAATLLAIRIK